MRGLDSERQRDSHGQPSPGTTPSAVATANASISSTDPLHLTGTGAATASLSGHWTVASGSVAGYRVHESFLGQDTIAIARTTGLAGQAEVSVTAVTNLVVTADLSGLHGIDGHVSYAGFNRDNSVSRALNLSQDPTATLKVSSLSLPANASAGTPVDLQATGTLAVGGVTKSVTVKLKGQAEGDRLEVAGTFDFSLSPFDSNLPNPPFTHVGSTGTVEVDVFFVRGLVDASHLAQEPARVGEDALDRIFLRLGQHQAGSLIGERG